MPKPAPPGEDPYERPREVGQEAVLDNEDLSITDRYEMERLLDRRVTGRGKSATVQYLVMWKGWDSVHN